MRSLVNYYHTHWETNTHNSAIQISRSIKSGNRNYRINTFIIEIPNNGKTQEIIAVKSMVLLEVGNKNGSHETRWFPTMFSALKKILYVLLEGYYWLLDSSYAVCTCHVSWSILHEMFWYLKGEHRPILHNVLILQCNFFIHL